MAWVDVRNTTIIKAAKTAQNLSTRYVFAIFLLLRAIAFAWAYHINELFLISRFNAVIFLFLLLLHLKDDSLELRRSL
ncbi:hypothetical protein NOC27_2111 [Nitrosococcus oceani AFC27]|nr:hypothetical protein NOC27_2111 [Nitrosococcus oceani AFC27]